MELAPIKKTMTSLELVEQINIFRKEDGKSELLHKTLLEIIRDEFEEEISRQEILPSEYISERGQKYPMFILTTSQSKQVLVRESKTVRKAVIIYIEKLENALQPQLPTTYKDALIQLVAEIEEKEKLQEENQLLLTNNENLEIELDEHKAWYSVKRVCLLGHFKNRDAKTLWQSLKAYSIANNYQIKGIFDANYGEVKTYHKEVWKAVYNINL